MEKNHTGIFLPNISEMHLLHDCEDLVSMQRKQVSDVKDGIQANLSQENPLLGKHSEKFHDLASDLRNQSCFEIPSLLLHSTSLKRYFAVIAISQFKRYSTNFRF